MTKTFRIENRLSGADLGVYEAKSAEQALDAMARDAGYDSFEHSCTATNLDADDQSGQIIVTEVEGEG